MKSPPFHYASPVIKKSFIDRKKESNTLLNNLTQMVHTAVLSPRGWGKTSLVRKISNVLLTREPTTVLVHLNVFPVSGATEFLTLFARAVVTASSEKWTDWIQIIQTYLSRTSPEINLGTRPDQDFTLEFNNEKLLAFPEEILNLPEYIGSEKDLQFVIIIDEFQQFEKMHGSENLAMNLKTILNKKEKAVYCFAGQNTPWMIHQFKERNGTFRDFVEVLPLEQMESKYWIKYIGKGFSKTGKNIRDSTIKSMIKQVRNHPYYLQQFARFTWLNTGKKAGKKEVEYGLKELMAVHVPLFRKTVESLSATQINLLKAIASGEIQLTGARAMQQYKLGTPRNVAKNRDMLLRKELIVRDKKQFEFPDPVFEHWFRANYLI